MREQSFRIMEALSGVDEDLLAGCGLDEGQAARRHGNAPRRCFRGLAAAMCLAVIGAAGWGGYRFMHKGTAQDTGRTDHESSYLLAADGREQEEAGGEQDAPSMEYAAGGGQEEALMEDAKPLTLEEAGNVEILGDYVPRQLPEGYAFREAFVGESEEGGLTVVFGNGTDSFVLVIKACGDSVSVVDIDRPEAYDRRLYEIPYEETVPEEYRESFLDPVFASEDFGLETVRSRMVSLNGADTPEGWFKVLYPQGVLLDFNGSGTSEEIWEMLRVLEEDVR